VNFFAQLANFLDQPFELLLDTPTRGGRRSATRRTSLRGTCAWTLRTALIATGRSARTTSRLRGLITHVRAATIRLRTTVRSTTVSLRATVGTTAIHLRAAFRAAMVGLRTALRATMIGLRTATLPRATLRELLTCMRELITHLVEILAHLGHPLRTEASRRRATGERTVTKLRRHHRTMLRATGTELRAGAVLRTTTTKLRAVLRATCAELRTATWRRTTMGEMLTRLGELTSHLVKVLLHLGHPLCTEAGRSRATGERTVTKLRSRHRTMLRATGTELRTGAVLRTPTKLRAVLRTTGTELRAATLPRATLRELLTRTRELIAHLVEILFHFVHALRTEAGRSRATGEGTIAELGRALCCVAGLRRTTGTTAETKRRRATWATSHLRRTTRTTIRWSRAAKSTTTKRRTLWTTCGRTGIAGTRTGAAIRLLTTSRSLGSLR